MEAQPSAEWRVELQDEAATLKLARTVATMVQANDLVTLSGKLGAGKTTFARFLIRHLTRDPTLEVPSPTYTLMQIYQGPEYPIVHADLYRIQQPGELAELGWEEAADGALVLVEWAERAGEKLPADRLDLELSLDIEQADDRRHARILGWGSFAARVERAKAIDAILTASGWADAERSFMTGDASTRAYERLSKPATGETAVLMIAPPRPDGPPIRFGKSYSEIARLSENIDAYAAVDRVLSDQLLSVPAIHACDFKTGLAVLEDFGSAGVVDGDAPIADRYTAAAAVLAALHGMDLPETVTIDDGRIYTVPPYDTQALLIEIELILDWYAYHVGQTGIASGARASFMAAWKTVLEEIVASGSCWTLRDYHSPNLFWLDDREGLRRVGIIDFQDCVIGHPAYDVVSLAQDARVTVSDELELRLLTHYARARRQSDASFDMASFARAYAVLGAQRATKILGIFARLDQRDGKPHYLAHLPRVEAYLARNLAHPALAEIKSWYDAYLPQALGSAA